MLNGSNILKKKIIMNQQPLVSVVLTSFNQCTLLKRAYESLVNQTYKNIEIIVVDDCSTEPETIAYLKELKDLCNKNIVINIQEVNVGITKNKNTGYRLAKGDYITYLDGDDYYFDTKIEKEVEFLKDNSNFDVVYSNFLFVDEISEESNKWIKEIDTPPTGDVFINIFTRQFPKKTLFRFELMRREVLETINYYDETRKAYEDWDSRIRYSKLFKIGYVDNVGSVYFLNPESISQRWTQIKHLLEKEQVFFKNQNLLKGSHKKDVNFLLGNELLELRTKLFKNNTFYSLKNLIKQFFIINKIDFNYLIKTLNGGRYSRR
ncbi:glycosyltransferase family 2 protein [Formosa sp. L2A11]|uniref:glycosyltransferase family 2 protein n=1 Tax=Formosa sp. L2A11 TaxID=2686363 RepID=UPI00131BA1D4|nr:glycosyltransferase family 2 protein [Formosa sp. L2A11]